MAAAAIPPKHKIDFTVTGNADAKRASLTGLGPLNVTPPELYSVSSLAARDCAAHELPRSRLRSLQLAPSIAARLHGDLALITPPGGGLLVLLAP